MDIKINRIPLKDTYTIGELLINNKFFCDTLEDTVREPGIKIYGKTAIPYGTYKVEIKHSPSFNRLMPYIKDVPGFTDIMIHCGNTDADTKGCVLIGHNTEIGKITQSIVTFKAFWEKIKDETDITLTIQ